MATQQFFRREAKFLEHVNPTDGAGSITFNVGFPINGLMLNNTTNARFNIYFGAVSVDAGNLIPDFFINDYNFATIPCNGQSTSITIQWTAPTVTTGDNFIRVDLTEERLPLSYTANPPSSVGTGLISNVTVVGALPAGTNNIGHVTVDGTVTTSLTGTPTVDIGTMPAVEISNDAGNPIPVSGVVIPTNGSFVNGSASITTANTSQQIAAADGARKYMLIQNLDPDTDLWINFGGTAAIDAGGNMLLAPRTGFVMEGSFVSGQTVNAISTLAGHKLTYKEGN